MLRGLEAAVRGKKKLQVKYNDVLRGQEVGVEEGEGDEEKRYSKTFTAK